MKSLIFSLRGLALASALILALGVHTSLSAATTSPQAAKVADLQLQITVPPTWRPFLADDIADSLAGILSATFQRRGFAGVVDYIEEGRRVPNPDIPLLTLNLVEWRIDRVGNAECTLTATLSVSGQRKDLGIVNQTQMTWIRERGRFGLARRYEVADALEDAAAGAMRDLFHRVAETGLVCGLPPKQAK